MNYQHKQLGWIAKPFSPYTMKMEDENGYNRGRIQTTLVENSNDWQPLLQYNEGDWLKTYNGSIFRYIRTEGHKVFGDNYVCDWVEGNDIIMEVDYHCDAENIERKATTEEIQKALKDIAEHFGIVIGAYVESFAGTKGKIKEVYTDVYTNGSVDLWAKYKDDSGGLMYNGYNNSWGKVLEPPRKNKQTIYINGINTNIEISKGEKVEISLK